MNGRWMDWLAVLKKVFAARRTRIARRDSLRWTVAALVGWLLPWRQARGRAKQVQTSGIKLQRARWLWTDVCGNGVGKDHVMGFPVLELVLNDRTLRCNRSQYALMNNHDWGYVLFSNGICVPVPGGGESQCAGDAGSFYQCDVVLQRLSRAEKRQKVAHAAANLPAFWRKGYEERLKDLAWEPPDLPGYVTDPRVVRLVRQFDEAVDNGTVYPREIDVARLESR